MLDNFGIKLTVAVILLLIVVGITGAVYRDKYITYLLHSRNRGGFIFAFLYAAINLILSRYNLLSTIATYVLLVMDIAFVAYCSYLVKHSSFFAGHILDIFLKYTSNIFMMEELLSIYIFLIKDHGIFLKKGIL